MADIDDYARDVFESAKLFLVKAKRSKGDTIAEQAYLRSALLNACCFLECQVNMLCDHFSGRKEFNVAERGLLSEKEVKITNGRFTLAGTKYYRLEDRILLLIDKFSDGFDKNDTVWWGLYRDAISLRNLIAHPRSNISLEYARVENDIRGILELADFLMLTIFGKGLPYAGRGLTPKYDY